MQPRLARAYPSSFTSLILLILLGHRIAVVVDRDRKRVFEDDSSPRSGLVWGLGGRDDKIVMGQEDL